MGRITDHPDMSSAVYSGHKATNQTNKQSVLWKTDRVMRKPAYCIWENKGADHCAVTM